MARVDHVALFLLALYVLVTAASFVSPNLTTAESGNVQASTSRVPIEETDMKKRGLKANEVANSTSVLSPSGPDPTHDNSNMSNTNLANSTLYNSYGALNTSRADPYHDYINGSDTKGANSGSPLLQLELVLYISGSGAVGAKGDSIVTEALKFGMQHDRVLWMIWGKQNGRSFDYVEHPNDKSNNDY